MNPWKKLWWVLQPHTGKENSRTNSIGQKLDRIAFIKYATPIHYYYNVTLKSSLQPPFPSLAVSPSYLPSPYHILCLPAIATALSQVWLFFFRNLYISVSQRVGLWLAAMASPVSVLEMQSQAESLGTAAQAGMCVDKPSRWLLCNLVLRTTISED